MYSSFSFLWVWAFSFIIPLDYVMAAYTWSLVILRPCTCLILWYIVRSPNNCPGVSHPFFIASVTSSTVTFSSWRYWKTPVFYLMLSGSMNNDWNRFSRNVIFFEHASLSNYALAIVAWDTNHLSMKNYWYEQPYLSNL